jgi:hypothetical protein
MSSKLYLRPILQFSPDLAQNGIPPCLFQRAPRVRRNASVEFHVESMPPPWPTPIPASPLVMGRCRAAPDAPSLAILAALLALLACAKARTPLTAIAGRRAARHGRAAAPFPSPSGALPWVLRGRQVPCGPPSPAVAPQP